LICCINRILQQLLWSIQVLWIIRMVRFKRPSVLMPFCRSPIYAAAPDLSSLEPLIGIHLGDLLTGAYVLLVHLHPLVEFLLGLAFFYIRSTLLVLDLSRTSRCLEATT
jgi:hypothetical protein